MLVDILVPIFICCVLPCVVVFINAWVKRNEINRRTEVALKAMETGTAIDPKLLEGNAPGIKERVFSNLRRGLICIGLGLGVVVCCIFAKDGAFAKMWEVVFGLGGALVFLGLAFVVAYFVSRAHFSAEIKAEEAKLGKK